MTIDIGYYKDANGYPLWTDGLITSKAISYTGAAGLGAQGATTLFTVTGAVIAATIAVCSEDLASTTGTIEVGVSGNTAAIIAQTTATGIDNGEIWLDASPATIENYAMNTIRKVLSANIIETVATADITDGTLTYYCIWNPISSNGNVAAA